MAITIIKRGKIPPRETRFVAGVYKCQKCGTLVHVPSDDDFDSLKAKPPMHSVEKNKVIVEARCPVCSQVYGSQLLEKVET